MQPGTIVVDDRGYNDYELFGRWSEEQVYFVTRLKDNARYRVVKNLPLSEKPGSPILKDQRIRFTGVNAGHRCPQEMRLVTFYDQEQQRTFEFLINHFGLAARTIAAIYKDRWAVELFQGPETESEDQDLRRYLSQRRQDPGLDGADRHAAAALPAAEVKVGLVALQPRGAIAHEPVHAP